ncbi:MAG: aminotransferase class I/II-fold pyridoxal phosphate-dependent enzyme [Candidatus Micrarchaeota archaeon]
MTDIGQEQIKTSEKSKLVSYPIRDIVQEAKALERSGTKMVYLNIGDPAPFGFRPPQHILDAVKEALDNTKYSAYAPSDGDPELKESAAEYEGDGVTAGDVFVTSGLSEGISFLFRALLDPGQNIILPSPTYPLYLTEQRLAMGKETFYACDERSWEPDVDSLRKNIDQTGGKTRAVLVINPNNPTGSVYPEKILRAIVDVAGEYNLPIISDDAYEMLIFDEDSGYVNLRKIHKDVPLISGNSISKNYIYPGARVGYIAFHDGEGKQGAWTGVKDAIQRLCNARLSVNWEMQRGAISAIRGPKNHISEFNSQLKTRRDVLAKRIGEIDGLGMVSPKGAFYSFVKIEQMGNFTTDWEFVRALLKEGVVVVPGSAFTTLLPPTYFRIVFLPQIERINEAMDKIAAFMKKNCV